MESPSTSIVRPIKPPRHYLLPFSLPVSAEEVSLFLSKTSLCMSSAYCFCKGFLPFLFCISNSPSQQCSRMVYPKKPLATACTLSISKKLSSEVDYYLQSVSPLPYPTFTVFTPHQPTFTWRLYHFFTKTAFSKVTNEFHVVKPNGCYFIFS